MSSLIGVHADIPNADYHASEGLSSSALKLMLKSPLHYKHQYIDGHRNGSTAAMLMGSLVHTMVLEPEKMASEYLVVDVSTRTTKAYKEAVAAMAPNLTAVLQHEVDRAQRIADAVLSHTTASTLLSGCVSEHSVYWDEDGQLAKCRPDIWRQDINVLADLKTTASAAPADFSRDIYNLGYHISAEWYMRGVERITGSRPDSWAWVCVEKEAPFAVQVYEADRAMLDRAHDSIEEALETLRRCHETNHWPAYIDGIAPISLPGWAA